MTAGPPTEPPILTAEEVAEMLGGLRYPNHSRWAYASQCICDSHEALRADRDALRARLRDAEEILRRIGYVYKPNEFAYIACAYFDRHADPQEKP